MNREIKFRAWDKIDKEIFTPHSTPLRNIEDMDSLIPRIKVGTTSYKLREYIIFMQYTGLKDKNGKEIYEGDIIKATPSNGDSYISEDNGRSPLVRIIVWKEEDAQFGWTFLDRTHSGSGYILCKSNGEKLFEIIGNIYENPELLTGETDEGN